MLYFVVASLFFYFFFRPGLILVVSAGQSSNHCVNGRGLYWSFESNSSAQRVGVAPPYAAVV